MSKRVPPQKWEYLSCAVETVDGQTVLQVEGEIDLRSVPHFEQWLQHAHGLDLPVTVDLRKVSYMDSIGIKTLETSNRALVKITLVVAPGTLSKLLAVVGLEERFTVQEDGGAGGV